MKCNPSQLAKDDDSSVMEVIAINPNTPEVLAKLAKDSINLTRYI
jgi:hypothetical protein